MHRTETESRVARLKIGSDNLLCFSLLSGAFSSGAGILSRATWATSTFRTKTDTETEALHLPLPLTAMRQNKMQRALSRRRNKGT